MRPPATTGARVEHGQSRRPPTTRSQARTRTKPRAKTPGGLPLFRPFRDGRSGAEAAARAGQTSTTIRAARAARAGAASRGSEQPTRRDRSRVLANEAAHYDGPDLRGEIRAYRTQPVTKPGVRRGSRRNGGVPAPRARVEAPRARVKAPSRGPVEAPRARAQAPRARAQAPRARAQAPRGRVEAPRARVHAPRARVKAPSRAEASGRQGPRTQWQTRAAVARGVAGTGGGAALAVGKVAVGKVVADVARPAAAAAAPVLRVVAGGIDRLPTSAVSQPAARGRILIVVAGLLAAGLIYINVGKLQAGDGYARYAERSLELQRQNTILRGTVARLGASERIVRLAKKMGMVMPQPEQFKFLRSRSGDAARALRNYSAPRPAPVASPQAQLRQQSSAPAAGGDASPTAPNVQQAPQPPGVGGSPTITPGASPGATPGAANGVPNSGIDNGGGAPGAAQDGR